MGIDDIFKKRKERWNYLKNLRKNGRDAQITCPDCGQILFKERLEEEAWICPFCHIYLKLPALARIEMVCDKDSFREKFADLRTGNPLSYPDYEKKIQENMKKTGEKEAFLCGSARIHSVKVAIGVLDSRFLMGSMGSVVGEKICRLAAYARKRKHPLIIFSASGGARMQEGLFALMQMANTSAEISRLKEEKGLFISCLTNPTTGGVSASYASLGNVILAEPDALICFAGPRVIEQTIGQTLPEGFQRAEFLLEHGMIDRIVERKDFRETLARIISMHGYKK